jgi:uncharacterized protein (TIGR00251 family)
VPFHLSKVEWTGNFRRVSLPSFIKAGKGGVYLSVKLQPRASKNEIGGPLGDELKISVTAPPIDSAANQALIDLLADALDCPRGSIQIVKGQTSRRKTIFISGKSADEIGRTLIS